MNGRTLLSFGLLLTTSVYHATVHSFSFRSPEQRVACAMRQMERAMRECRAENGQPVDSQRCQKLREKAMQGLTLNGSAIVTDVLFDDWRRKSEATEQEADEVWNNRAEREAVLLGHLDESLDDEKFKKIAALPGAEQALVQLGYDSDSCFDENGKTKRECRMILLLFMRLQLSMSDLIKQAEQENDPSEEERETGVRARIAQLIERLPL